MKIDYRIYDYTDADKNKCVVELYRNVFGTSFEELGYKFKPNPFGVPICVLALTNEEQVIGHFSTMATEAIINDKLVKGRISFGFMVDQDYQGQGIAKSMAKTLFDYLKAEGNCDFVIGFPNDNSLYMHCKYMGYSNLRDYQMVRIPQNKEKTLRVYSVNVFSDDEISSNNRIAHSAEMLNWHFRRNEYLRFEDDKGNYYVCNRYKDSIQIVYWSPTVSKIAIESFAAYLHNNYSIESVRTWNTFDWQESYEKEERKFHFTINVIKEELKEKLLEKWIFYPGDCELF